ncbi:MAG: DUF4062 domain-containing protein [bacterium]|nr:DUF4062 domain-containing protein [bacterium]
MAKIYLSSTYEDLAEHRQAVYRVLRQMGHDVISMEDYTATGRQPTEKCLADVRECGIYVGIFAWRYGYVPPEETRAITELEYREALDAGKETLIFLLNDDAPWSPTLIDRDRTAIEALRGELQTSHIVQFFSTAEELAAAVSVSVANVAAEDSAGESDEAPDPSTQRFYLKCLSKMTGELDSQIKIYRTACVVLIGIAVAVGIAGVAMKLLFVGLGGLLVGTATVFPTNTMLHTRRKKALLDGYEEGLRQEPPASDVVRAVKAFLERQLRGESFA